MAPYRIVCRNDVCQHRFIPEPNNLLILVFKRPGIEKRFLFTDCPECYGTDCRPLSHKQLSRWRKLGVIVLKYSYDNSSDETISKLLYFPDELTYVHCDLAAVTVMSPRAFRRDLDEHIFTDGPAPSP